MWAFVIYFYLFCSSFFCIKKDLYSITFVDAAAAAVSLLNSKPFITKPNAYGQRHELITL